MSYKKSTFLLLTLTVFLHGCASHRQPSRIAVLQNPETKQTVECRVDPWGDLNHARQVESCIYAYQKAGYKILSDSLNQY